MDDVGDYRRITFSSVLWGAVHFFWELIKVFVVAMVIILPIRYFLVQPFFVRGASMEQSFLDGEYLVIDELSYRLREPKRGEVIVFHFPDNPSQFFIKRIIGLPRETVKIDNGQVLILNAIHPQAVVLDESSYLPPGVRTGGSMTSTLGTDDYFVLGDNRAASSDSRVWGLVQRSAIVGRAWVRAFPIDRVGLIPEERPGFLGL